MDAVEKRFLAKVFKEEGDDGCWIWIGAAPSRASYGVMRVAGRSILAHRLSYEIYKGPIPAGMHVCHTCDRPPCVNPAHLFTGTHLENMRDKVKKGRHYTGEVDPALHAESVKAVWARHTEEERKARIEAVSRALKGKLFTDEHLANLRASPANKKGRPVRFIPQRKLPLHRVLDLLQRYAAGASQEDLAKEFKVSRGLISKITGQSFIDRVAGYGTSQLSLLHEHANTGAVRSEEQRLAHAERIRELHAAGRYLNRKSRPKKEVVPKDPITSEQWSEIRKKVWANMSPEVQQARAEKIAASKLGKKLSPEHIAKLRAAKLGKPAKISEEAKARRAEKLRAIWNDPTKRATQTPTEQQREANSAKHRELWASGAYDNRKPKGTP